MNKPNEVPIYDPIKTFKIQMMDIKELRTDGINPNRMTKQNFTALKENIKRYGFLVPIITNEAGLIADGEHRFNAAKELEMKEVPVIKVPLKEVDRRMIRQIMNKLKGEHDKDKDIEEYKYFMEQGEWEQYLNLLPEETAYEKLLKDGGSKDPDAFDVENAAKEPKYQVSVGDLYRLGDHFLFCGDATNPEHMTKLCGINKIDMVWTDPPYGVSYTGLNNPNGREWNELKNDDLRGKSLYTFLNKSFRNIYSVTKSNPAIYCCFASVNHEFFEKALNDAAIRVKQVLIWDKGHILGRSDYHWCHEPILYCIKKDHNCNWHGDRTQKTILENTWKDLEGLKKEELLSMIKQIREDSDVLRIRKDFAGDYIHPTQKPVELSQRCIRNSTSIGMSVLDPFAGSGSVIIACEIIKRKAFIMELDPSYASACIERWESFTGFKSKKL